jgi:3-methylfumaryl-CoA hydratase
MPISEFSAFIGAETTVHDRPPRSAFRRLRALFDRPGEDADVLPPLGHWLCFLSEAAQQDIGADGHPARGGLYPDLGLALRMWAGSRIRFLAPLPFDADLKRVSRLEDLQRRTGRTGDLIFATVRSRVFANGTLCVEEDQDIVFRNRSATAPAPAAPCPEPDATRVIEPSSALLFRFSALTYNSHRIHYDRPYTTGVEGYPGLLVHGPLQAMAMADLWERLHPSQVLKAFEVRAERPLFDLSPFTVNHRRTDEGSMLWTADSAGGCAMRGRAEF